jgi:hypothetical protein
MDKQKASMLKIAGLITETEYRNAVIRENDEYKIASIILKDLKKNYTDEELESMSREDATDAVEARGHTGPEVQKIVDALYNLIMR